MNETLDNYKKRGAVKISTTVDPRLATVAKSNNISWARAIELGLQIICNEIDPVSYPVPDCQMSRKMDKMRQLLEEKSQELEILTNERRDD